MKVRARDGNAQGAIATYYSIKSAGAYIVQGIRDSARQLGSSYLTANCTHHYETQVAVAVCTSESKPAGSKER